MVNATMLTAQQVQDLLDVDASTVYRMAGDGRLPAVRIGRQWRFPADEIQRLLQPMGPVGADGADVPDGAVPTASAVSAPPGLSEPVTTAVLELVAPLLGVTMVVTDLHGRPISQIVNPAPAIERRLDDPEFLVDCTTEWQTFAAEPHLAPRLQPASGGFLCAHALVRHGTTLIAMVLAGGIALDAEPDLYHLDVDRRREVLDTLPRTAALLSRLAADPAEPTHAV